MTLRGTIPLATVGSLILSGRIAAAAGADPTPDFKEVYGLLQAHLPGASDENLNQAAVAGLLSQLGGRARLVNRSAASDTNTAPVTAVVLSQTVEYLRIGLIAGDLPTQLSASSQTLSASNKLTGTIVDLRFAAGDSYPTVKSDIDVLTAPKTPVIVLVNGATSGAAEVLAAELRNAGALIIGNPTAGLAMTTEDFPLANGQSLRIATSPIVLHGSVLTRLQPDISVATTLDQDRGFMENPWGPAFSNDNGGSPDTNSLAELLDHTSEADLVRQKRKDGDGSENPEPPVKTDRSQPVLRDPALARAVDLVEGLAVVRAGHP